MRKSDFDYELPKELIAQVPLTDRSASRLMTLNRKTGETEDHVFSEIVEMLRPGDVLVRNNSRVLPARLFGTKKETGAHVELLLLRQEGDTWECLVGNAKVVKEGTVVSFGEDKLLAKCTKVKENGLRDFEMIYEGIFNEILNELGETPLPPYIHEKLQDKERYQTVYAKVDGSAAAPTAGLHFTEEIFEKLREKGVEVLDVTLHVGLGTFKPLKEDDVLDHQMHEEYYSMSEETAAALNKAKAEGRRIIAVGTTSCRTLESVMQKYGEFKGCSDYTGIYIYPGYEFKAIDALITNFHLPESTLILLVSAFSSREFILSAYRKAIEEKYRFFSFGDAMFIY